MLMKAVAQPKTDLKSFLEIVLMWHKAGDVPRDMASMNEFIDDDSFPDFLMSVSFWCREFGLRKPTKRDIVKTLHSVVEELARV